MLHSLCSTFQEDLLELQEKSVPLIIVWIVDQVEHLGNCILAFLKLIWILFGAAIFFILKEWHDELDELVNCLR